MNEEKPRSLAAAENLTLWSLLATVSLYTAGQIAHFYRLAALGVRGQHSDAQWQDRVFEGGLTVVNGTLNVLDGGALPWAAALLIFAAALWARRRRGPGLRRFFTGVAISAYVVWLLLLSMHWGRRQADFVREAPGHDHFLFTADAAARLPGALLDDNAARKLRVLDATPDFFLVLSGDGKVVYRIATREVDLQDSGR